MIRVQLDLQLDAAPGEPHCTFEAVRRELAEAIEAQLIVWVGTGWGSEVRYDVTVLAAREPLDPDAVMRLVDQLIDERDKSGLADDAGCGEQAATWSKRADATEAEIRRLLAGEAAG